MSKSRSWISRQLKRHTAQASTLCYTTGHTRPTSRLPAQGEPSTWGRPCRKEPARERGQRAPRTPCATAYSCTESPLTLLRTSRWTISGAATWRLFPYGFTLAERFLIYHYRPIWNIAVDGFGNNPQGRHRSGGDRSWWDTSHPGRQWASTRTPKGSEEDAIALVVQFFAEVQSQ